MVAMAATFACASACAGGDPDGRATTGDRPPEGTSLEGGSFVRRANQVCRKAARRVDALDPEPRAPAEWRRYGRRVDDVFEVMLDELERLDPPESVRSSYGRWLHALDTAKARLRDFYLTVSRTEAYAPLQRVYRRSFNADRKAGTILQTELTDLGACFSGTPSERAYR